jgi:hypothetical protein
MMKEEKSKSMMEAREEAVADVAVEAEPAA